MLIFFWASETNTVFQDFGEIQWLVVAVPLVLVMPLDLLVAMMDLLEMVFVLVTKVSLELIVLPHVLARLPKSVLMGLLEMDLVSVLITFLGQIVTLVLAKTTLPVLMATVVMELVFAHQATLESTVPLLSIVEPMELLIPLPLQLLQVLEIACVQLDFMELIVVHLVTVDLMEFVNLDKVDLVLVLVLLDIPRTLLEQITIKEPLNVMSSAPCPAKMVVSVVLELASVLLDSLVLTAPVNVDVNQLLSPPMLSSDSNVLMESLEMEPVFCWSTPDHPFNPFLLFLL